MPQGMYNMQDSTFGKAIAIFPRYKVLEDATKAVKSDAVVFSGRPMTLSTAHDAYDGQLIPLITNVKPYGLAKFQKNSYVDEVSGALGFYGSGNGTVVLDGIVEIQQNVFTLTDGSEVTVNVYDSSLTYYPMDPLYVEITDAGKRGQITKVLDGANTNTLLGYVLKAPTATDPTMQILLKTL